MITLYKGIELEQRYPHRDSIRFKFNGEFYYAGSLLSAKRFVNKLLKGTQ